MTPTAPPALDAPFDVAAVRAQFPLLAQPAPGGRRLAFLDSAASAQKPLAVLEAVDALYRTEYANVHRGVYRLSERATSAYEAARGRVARFIGAGDHAEVVFTRGTTEAINLFANAWGGANVRRGDAIVLTEMEHHANLVPWQLLAERTGAELRFLRVADDGRLDLGGLDQALDGPVKLVALTHVSNVLGTRNPVAQIAAAAHAAGAIVLLDAAQSVPHEPVDVAALGIDALAFSGHKAYGPTGIGALWARRALLEAMPPWQGGGEMIASVTLERSTWAAVPHKFEAGTPAFAQAVGLGAALDWLAALGMARVAAHGQALAGYAMARLLEVPGVTVYGPPADARGPLVAFTVAGVHAHDLATILDTRGVAVRAGHHCAMPLHTRLGVSATARASFGVYTDEMDVDALIEGLHAARGVFGLGGAAQ